MGDRGPRPLGRVGRALPGRRGGDQPAQGCQAPEGAHGHPHPRTTARAPGAGADRRPAAQDRRGAADRCPPDPPWPGGHHPRADLDPLGHHPSHRQDLGRRPNLGMEEDLAFWAWATVEVLRATGVRIEELTELSHHSLVQYRLPTTGELVPLLQIAPSKTDTERLLVVSPELAEVLSAIIRRVRSATGAIPVISAYDRRECVWLAPSPWLFQRRLGTEHRRICEGAIRNMLNAALAHTGLTDPATGSPLHFTPHDFRRIFITDAILNGLPPHIAQVIAGHHDI